MTVPRGLVNEVCTQTRLTQSAFRL